MRDEMYLMGLDLPGTPEECAQDNERLRKENAALRQQADTLAGALERLEQSSDLDLKRYDEIGKVYYCAFCKIDGGKPHKPDCPFAALDAYRAAQLPDYDPSAAPESPLPLWTGGGEGE